MAKIKKKTFFHYTGKVHDLTVENSHTYNIEGKAVHNSAAGSLVAYVLGITNVDPIPHGLLFSRFLSVERCLHPDTLVLTPGGSKKIKSLEVGDEVIGGSGLPRKVISRFESKAKSLYRITVAGQTIECSDNHVWPVERDGRVVEVMAKELKPDDILLVR